MKNLLLSGIVFFIFCSASAQSLTHGKVMHPDTLTIGGKVVSYIKAQREGEGDFIVFENTFYRIVISNETIKQKDWKFERENFIISEGILKSARENDFKIEKVPMGKQPTEPKIKQPIEDYPLIGE